MVMTRICKLCAGEFTPNGNQRYCRECLRDRKREIDRTYEAKTKAKSKQKRKITATLRSKYAPSKTINEIVREVNAYNKKHGTHLTYGKYVEKMTLGLLKD